MLSINEKNCHVTQKIGIVLRTVERCSINKTRLIEQLDVVTYQSIRADEQWKRVDKYSNITL